MRKKIIPGAEYEATVTFYDSDGHNKEGTGEITCRSIGKTYFFRFSCQNPLDLSIYFPQDSEPSDFKVLDRRRLIDEILSQVFQAAKPNNKHIMPLIEPPILDLDTLVREGILEQHTQEEQAKSKSFS